jgi:hypothetical protein
MYGSIVTESCSPGLLTGAPHPPQNRFSRGLVAPHDGHAASSGAPHPPQNFIPARLSAWHREHRIPGLRRVTPDVPQELSLIPGFTRESRLLSYRPALLNLAVPRELAKVPTALREAATRGLREDKFLMSSVTDLTLSLFAR